MIFAWLRELFGHKGLDTAARRRPAREKKAHRASLRFESLEDRLSPTVNISVAGSTLNVAYSGAAGDSINITATAPGSFNFTANAGSITGLSNASGITDINVTNVSANGQALILNDTGAANLFSITGAAAISTIPTVTVSTTSALTAVSGFSASGATTALNVNSGGISVTGNNHNISLTGNGATSIGAPLSDTGNNGTITASSTGTMAVNAGISTSGGTNANISITGASVTQLLGTTVNAGTAAVTVTSTSGSVNLSGTLTTTSQNPSDFIQVTGATTVALGTVTDTTSNGQLLVSAGGQISQNGVITIGTAGSGTTQFTLTAANSDIVLNTQANDIAGTISFAGTTANIRDVKLRNTDAAAQLPTGLTGLANLRNLTLQYDNVPVALPGVTLTSAGSLAVTAGGAITQTAAVTVPGTSTFSAGANAITLGSSNNFSGAVSLSNSGANNVTVSNGITLTLGASTVGSGTFQATSTGGTSDLNVNGLLNSGDGVTLTAGRNLSFGAAGSISTAGTVALNTTATAGTVTQTGSSSVVAAGTLNIAAGSVGTGVQSLVFNATNLTANTSGNNGGQFLADTATVSLAASALSAGIGTVTLTGGTFQATGSQSLGGAFTVAGATYNANGQTTTVTGLTTVSSGTYTAGSGTQSLNGGLTVTGGNFTGSNGTVTTTNVSATGGNLTAPNSSGAFNVSGNLTFSSVTFGANGGTITFNGAGTQAIDGNGVSFNNVSHTGAGTMQLTGSFGFSAGGTLTNSNGTLDANGHTATVTGLTTISGGIYQSSTATQSLNGGLTVSGGTVTASTGAINTAALSISSTFTGDGGTVSASSVSATGGSFTLPSVTLSDSGNWSVASGVTFNNNGGTVAFTSGGTQTVDNDTKSFNNVSHTGAGTMQLLNNGLTAAGTLSQVSGIFDNSGLAVSALTFSQQGGTTQGAGTITSTNAIDARAGTVSSALAGPGLNKTTGGTLTLSGTNTYSGTTAITAGTLLANTAAANSATGTSTVNVSGTGTLGGSGNISGTVNVNAGGSITGGTLGGVGTLTVGALTFNGGTYNADFSGNTSDTISTGGAINLNGGTPGTFTVNSATGTPSASNVFTLINNTAAGAISNPPLTNATEGGNVPVGTTTTVASYISGTGANDFTLTVAGPWNITAPGGGTNITLKLDSTGTILQELNGAAVIDSRVLNAITSVNYTDSSGVANTLTIDYSGGGAGFFTKPVTYNGNGVTGEKLVITGNSFNKVTHTFTTTGPGHSGNIVYDTTGGGVITDTINYNGLAPIDETGSTITNLIFNLPNGGTTAQLEDDGASNTISQIRNIAGSAFETTTFANTITSLTVNGGTGTDILNLAALPDYGKALTINNAVETVNLNSSETFTSFNDQGGTTNTNVGAAVTIDTSAANGNITFANQVNGANALSLTAGGGAISLAAVGNTAPLTTLSTTTTGAGSTTLGGNVTTSSTQTYNGATTIDGGGTDTLTTTNSAVSFNGNVTLSQSLIVSGGNGTVGVTGTVSGAHALTINSTGQTTFGGAVGSPTQLTSVSVAGAAAVNGGSVSTTGTQGYTGAVTLGNNTTFTASTATFSSTVDGTTPVGQSLGVTGNASFNGAVGGNAINKITTVSVSGTTALNASVTSTSTQTYGTVAANTITIGFNSPTVTAGGTVTFNGNVVSSTTGTNGLTVSAGASAVNFNSTVGSVAGALRFLTVSTSNLTTLSGNVTTDNNAGGTGAVDFSAASGGVKLSTDITINTDAGGAGGGGAVTFDAVSAVNAAAAGTQALTITAANGAVTLFSVGQTTPLKSLSVTTSGTITLNGNIQTDSVPGTGNVSFAGGGNIILPASRTIDTESGDNGNGGTVNFGTSAVSASAVNVDLTVNTATNNPGATAGNVTLAAFNSTGGGTSVRNLSINASATGGGSTNHGSVTLTAAVSLTGTFTDTQTGGGSLAFTQNAGANLTTTDATTSAVSITVGGTGNASLRAISADTTSGRVTITAGGQVLDGSANAVTNVTAFSFIVNAVTGIGTGVGTAFTDALKTTISQLDANNSTSGGVYLSNLGGLTVTDLNTSLATLAGGGQISTHSPLTLSASQLVPGSMLFIAGDNTGVSGDDLTINNSAAVTETSNNATLTFQAGDNIIFATGQAATSGTGDTIVLFADHEDGASADGVRGSVTQTTGSTSVAAVSPTTLNINASNGVGALALPFILNIGGVGSSLTVNTSTLNTNQFLQATATLAGLTTPSALNAGLGTITLTGGTFQITAGASGNAITDNSPLVINSPGILDLNGQTEQVLTLAGTGTVTNSAATTTAELQIGVNNGTGATFSGIIQDGGGTAITAVRKIGNGTQTLSGVNIYTGVTNVDLGTLTLGAGGVINFNGTTGAGVVNLNTAGVILNGTGTIKGLVDVKASTNANPTQVTQVTVNVLAATGIIVEANLVNVQIGTVNVNNTDTSTGIKVNTGNSGTLTATLNGSTVTGTGASATTSIGLQIIGGAPATALNTNVKVLTSSFNANHVGVNVNNATAFIQGTHMDNNNAGSGATGLLVQNAAIVDAGELAASFNPPPAGGYYGDFTGLGGGTPSTGNNTFNGYTAMPSNSDTGAAQAIRDLNAGTAPFAPPLLGHELSNNYGAVGPQLGRLDVTAQNNVFNNNAGLTLHQIEDLIFHDVDSQGLGFVDYGSGTAPAPNVVGIPQYSANFALSATQGGTDNLISGTQLIGAGHQKSVIRYFQVVFDSFVFLDPNLFAPNTNLGLALTKLNGPYGAPAGTSIIATLFSATYNEALGQYTVTYAFTGPGVEYGSLEDGNYTLQFVQAGIQGGGPGGTRLTSNVSGNPYVTTAASFYRFFGDALGEGYVNNADRNAIQVAMNSRLGMTNYRAYFDFAARAYINSLDYSSFLKRYGNQLNPTGTTSPIDPTMP